jgi:sporulation protein YlmC with PRC-barrel domain
MFKTGAAALLAASIALPALAQTTIPPSRETTATGAPATHDTAGRPTSSADAPSSRNPVMTDNGGMRTSKIVGSSVYNDKDEKIGSVDDVVIGRDKSLNAVISVGGFLGMGSKMVEVPFDRLHFGNTKDSSDNRVVMPGVTKESLNGMPDYHYTAQG